MAISLTGGTEGHKQLFDAISELVLEKVIMQTGRVDPSPYKASHPNWEVITYSTDFERLIAESSIVITHQGGGTIFEAILYEKPLIIAFNPELTRTANTEDMRILAEKVNAPFLEQADAKKIESLMLEVHSVKRHHLNNGCIKAAEIIIRELN
jgi:UDP-N-acetylglucosamine:LPS N-acetylglucosamine transferase